MPNKYQIIEGFSSPEAKAHYPPDLQLEPIHQIIKLAFDIERRSAWGSVTTKIRANSDNCKKIVFDGVDFTIKDVKGVDSYSYDGEKISLIWNEPWKKTQEKDIEIKYSIEEPIAGLYFSYPDEKYPKRSAYAVTDHETERARYHIPCVDHPAIRCSIDFHLTADEKYTILANGKLIEEKSNGDGTKTAYWKQKFPCPSYLLTYAVGDFVIYEDKATDAGKGPIPVAYYTTSNYTSEILKRSFDRTPEMLEWLTKKMNCSLEWDKYYQIATPSYGGAMENISLVTWGDFALLVTEGVAKERWWFIDMINIHEMIHSWFGDMIVIKEYTHAWIKESMAVYITTCYYEDKREENEWKYDMFLNSVKYREESDSKYARPIVYSKYDSSWDMYDSHLYPGGACRIHMLRKLIGDQCFWEAISDYLQTFKGKVVETIDFQRKLEEHSGLSLQAFFDQWLHSPGYPKLKASFSYDEKSQLSSIKLEQNQIDEKKNIGVFSFPLDILWETDENTYERQTFKISEKVQTLYFKCKTKPKQVRIDPDYKLLCSLEFNPGTDMLVQQLKTGDIIAKIRTAKELSKKGKKKDLDTIKEAYMGESFWGTKVELASILRKSPSLYGIRILCKLLENEKDPLVLAPFLQNFKNVREEFVFLAMKKFLHNPEPYPYAIGVALEVIGSMRTEDAFLYLKNYQIPNDPRNLILASVYRAIGEIHTDKAIEYLQEKLPYGEESENVRGSILSGIIASLLWANEPVKKRNLEKILDLIPGESNERMLHVLARSLSSIKDPTVIGALNKIKVKLAKQDYPEIDRLIQKVQKASSTEDEVKNLKKELDTIKKSMKKLKESVEELKATGKEDSELIGKK